MTLAHTTPAPRAIPQSAKFVIATLVVQKKTYVMKMGSANVLCNLKESGATNAMTDMLTFHVALNANQITPGPRLAKIALKDFMSQTHMMKVCKTKSYSILTE